MLERSMMSEESERGAAKNPKNAADRQKSKEILKIVNLIFKKNQVP